MITSLIILIGFVLTIESYVFAVRNGGDAKLRKIFAIGITLLVLGILFK